MTPGNNNSKAVIKAYRITPQIIYHTHEKSSKFTKHCSCVADHGIQLSYTFWIHEKELGKEKRRSRKMNKDRTL